ncbi:NADH-dependent flavin oxidoreductase [Aerococcaceae bacterium DSM 111020]|nr:NADH-dependent flavin oxidoreductase [Aerococcaceae bacterium DSM 111020]
MTHNPVSPYPLKDGIELPTRFVMAPMVANASTYEGDVTEEDVHYFQRRANTASLLISGAAAVAPLGNAFGYGLGAYDDRQIDGLRQLAKAMKAKGNKALLQLFHPGRQAKYSYQDHGKVYGPSNKSLDFLDYPVTGLTADEVTDFIQAFADATRRAIEAGFDGVEIHGANHYLIQQFFSSLSNDRDDQWGGSLEKRSAFPLAVVTAVKEMIAQHKRDDFILGYRISPEEIHGENIGYTLDESTYLIDRVVELGVDYIHVSLFGPKAYKAKARAGKYEGQVINTVIGELIGERATHIGVGDITNYDKAIDALNYVDLLALGSAAIVDPEFQQKIIDGHPEKIELDVADNIDDLALPTHFDLMIGGLQGNQSVPDSTIQAILEDSEARK